jgi:hypothetical protein
VDKTQGGGVINIYQDNGCNVSPKCQECPLVACKHDDRSAYEAWLKVQRYVEVRRELERGTPLPEIAAKFKVSERTVSRVIAQDRAQRGLPRLKRGQNRREESNGTNVKCPK